MKTHGRTLCKTLCISAGLPIAWLFASTTASSQTVENPIEIELRPVSATLVPGQFSALTITFRIPRGFWLGENDRSARIPAATIIAMQPHESFAFDKPLFPEHEVRGVPVHLGVTRVFTGEVKVIVPFKVTGDAPPGNHTIAAKITYTPGLDAGHLTTHIREFYSTTVTVLAEAGNGTVNIPEPSIGPSPSDYFVQESRLNLPHPMKTMFHTWDEDGLLAKSLHRLFLDPENHGKRIQTVWHPFVGSTKKNGQSFGGAVALMNVTREGIMTGTLDIRGYHNEYVGATAALDVVSCPGAYFNYSLSAQLSDDRNRQVHFHIKNFTLGQNDRFGYEAQLDAFQDPRYRFFGLGGMTDKEDGTNYTHEEFGGILDLYWLPVNNFRFSVGGKIRSVDVKRGAERLAGKEPFTINEAGFFNVPGIQGATVVGERATFVYDGRNQEFTPSAGAYIKLTAEYNQVTSTPKPVSNYGRFAVDVRKYYSTVDQKFTLLLRNSWMFTTSENIPFFDQATLGGVASLRAFDMGRFYGRHSVFGSVELRYQAMHKVIMGFSMDLELAPFLDFGQVFNSTDFEGEFNFNPGLSMRVLNRPNVGFIANGAHGQDGLVFTGGVSLPF
ncbi:MAG: BamA/TamA family outer membrane protein [bacterium]